MGCNLNSNMKRGVCALCCRYYMEQEDPELLQIGSDALRSPLAERFLQGTKRAVLTAGEVRPNDIVPVVATSRNGRRACYPMQWGFHLNSRTLLPNARTESAAEKPLFREAWISHRCAVPASWYYEWEHILREDGKKETGDKYLLRPRAEHIAWLCGLYRFEDGFPHFSILTRAPTEEIRFIHDRMPLILRKEDADSWICPETKPEEILEHAVTDLHFEKAL